MVKVCPQDFCAYLAICVNFCARDPVLGSLWRLGRGPIPFEKTQFCWLHSDKIQNKKLGL